MTDQPDETIDALTEPVEPQKFEVAEPQYDLFEKGQKPPPYNTSADHNVQRPYVGNDAGDDN